MKSFHFFKYLNILKAFGLVVMLSLFFLLLIKVRNFDEFDSKHLENLIDVEPLVFTSHQSKKF